MSTMTDSQAEAARQELAAYEAAKAAEARAAENERRAAAREAVAPIVAVTGPDSDIRKATEALRSAAAALPLTEWDLGNLARNTVQCAESLLRRVERRVADIQPVPEPEPVAPSPSPEA